METNNVEETNQSLAGKRAFVSGAGRGIGLATARALARMGARVFIAARDGENLSRVEESLEGSGHGSLAADLSVPEACEDLKAALESWGQPHIVVANLHVRREAAPVHRADAMGIAAGVGENLNYLTMLMPGALREQARDGFGRWIGVSSGITKTGGPGQIAYAAAKSGLEALMLSLAVEQGARGITANIVSAGFIDTPGVAEHYDEERRQALSRMNLLKRAGRPEEVAHGIAFLASPLSGFITGINLPVCGGYDLGWPLADLVRDAREATHV